MALRSVLRAGLLCLALCVPVGLAAAQPTTPPVRSLAALFNRPAPVPATVSRLDGPATLAAGETGLFTAFANIETASLPLRSRWDFGDGTTAAGLHARHAFAEAGTYTVVFSLSNAHGHDADTLTVVVRPPPETGTAPARAAIAPDRPDDATEAAARRERRR